VLVLSIGDSLLKRFWPVLQAQRQLVPLFTGELLFPRRPLTAIATFKLRVILHL
jgi:hypothetical protein